MRRQRVPHLRTQRLDRASRRRDGASQRPARGGVRPRAMAGLRLRRRRRAPLDPPARRPRRARVPAERRALAGAVHAGDVAMLVRVPASWLREYVDIAVPLDELARLLTMAGIETEIVNDKAEMWQHMWVATITALARHPDATKLQLATVDYGHGTKQVVTGASNLKPGDVVPYAEVGASFIDGHTGQRETLRPTKIRGVRSEGMVMSEKELGLGPDHEGILHLNGDAKVGTSLAEALGESVLVCELQPNRADCLGILGVAREVAALLGAIVREPPLAAAMSHRAADFTVRVEAPDACPRYDAALIRGVVVGPSPAWLQQRLAAAGLR